jgi:hypothetical protein
MNSNSDLGIWHRICRHLQGDGCGPIEIRESHEVSLFSLLYEQKDGGGKGQRGEQREVQRREQRREQIEEQRLEQRREGGESRVNNRVVSRAESREEKEKREE